MITTGRAQRAGNRASRQGRNANNTLAGLRQDITKNVATSRAAKRVRFASIGDSGAAGLVIHGSHDHPQEEGTNPNGTSPPNSMVGTERPDFPISFSGRGIPKFTSNIRLAGIDGSTSVSGDLNVTGDLTVSGSAPVPANVLTTDGDPQTATGVLNLTNATNSTDETNGALVVTGGLGVSGDVHIGNTLTSGDGTVWPTHGLLTTGDQSSSGLHNFTNTTESTSTTTGALVVDGGTGIAKNLYIGGTLNIGGAHLSGNELAGMQSTGLEYGGELSVASGTTIAISDGAGVVIDSSNPASITETLVSWTGLTSITITNLANLFTYIYIDSTGSVVQSTADPPTPILRRDNIFLGKVFHADGATVTAVNNQPEIYNTALNQQNDFYRGLGPVVLSGLRATYNGANLSINISAGSLHQSGVNFHTDPQQPNVKDFVANALANIAMSTQTTIGSVVTVIDPGNYDVAGTITAIPGSSTRATNMRVYLFNSGFISVQYGQAWYGSLALAEQGITSESFVVEPFTISNGVLIGIISVIKGATDLSDPSEAVFFNASKFGEVSIGVGGTATANLQNVYDNSTQPQIQLSAALGALQIQDNATPIGAPLFEVLDSAGSQIVSVSDNECRVDGGVRIVDSGSLPGIWLDGYGATEGDITVSDGESMQFGHWNNGTTTFTERMTLNTVGDLDILSTTASTTPTTGALTVAGGTGINGALNVSGDVDITSTTASTDPITGALTVAGGAGINGALNVAGAVGTSGAVISTSYIRTYATDVSTSTTTGSLIAAGGVGISGDMNIGGEINCEDTTQSTSTSTGSVTTLGGVGIAKDVYCGGSIDITTNLDVGGQTTCNDYDAVNTGNLDIGNALTLYAIDIGKNLTSGPIRLGATGSNGTDIVSTANSTSTTTGALRIAGGMGVVNDTFIGGDLDVAGEYKNLYVSAETSINDTDMTIPTSLTAMTVPSFTVTPNATSDIVHVHGVINLIRKETDTTVRYTRFYHFETFRKIGAGARTSINVAGSSFRLGGASSNFYGQVVVDFYDEPNTTSSTVYDFSHYTNQQSGSPNLEIDANRTVLHVECINRPNYSSTTETWA